MKKTHWIYFPFSASHSLDKGPNFLAFSFSAKAFLPTLDVIEVPPESPASNFPPLGDMHGQLFSKSE